MSLNDMVHGKIGVPRRLNCVLALAALTAAVLFLWRSKRHGQCASESIDIVEENSLQSFPASDSPCWNPPGSFMAT